MSCLKDLKSLGWHGNEKNTFYVYNLLKSLQDLSRSLKLKVIGSTAIELYNEHISKQHKTKYTENNIIDLLINENENVLEHLQKTFVDIKNIGENTFYVDNMFILRFHNNTSNCTVTLSFWDIDIDDNYCVTNTENISNHAYEGFNYTFFHY